VKRERWINVRFERRIAEIIDQVCRARGEDRSSFIRWAVKNALATLNYLTSEEKKALGILEAKRERGRRRLHQS
jgi:metal-responsive CopG/Arc/MetJ family transcriptional regulator